ncbi:MAG: polysaccharide biosynthesis/export family protein [Paludibacteraceae bacterium]|nr:polysaccharide biosynthesis/export family protein [Paludibacteraceae bacterium]MBR6043525.1 polysaccharide biosynthesis/export family protein [Paludibacteraceae bacterium]
MKRKIQIIAVALTALLLSSCNASKDVVYVQELGNCQYVKMAEPTMLTMRPGDRLSVMVYCDNAVIASAFNLSSATAGMGSGGGGGTKEGECYTVDTEGNIKLPTLGKVQVKGKTREEISKLIEDMLVEQKLLRNPVVTVEVKDMFITVMGEVSEPQRVPFTKDKVTLTEVISECGDLDLNGDRVIKVMRPEEDNKMVCYTVDLRSARNLYSSPVYYLRPGDVIYVQPNQYKANQTRVNANNLRTPSFWISIGTLITTVLVLVNK